MDFVPAIFNSIAAIIVIFTTLPLTLALPMMLVIPIGVLIVFKQISSQKGIRVELLQSKSQMDGTIVELINGIEVIRISDSVEFETTRFDDKSEFLRKKEMNIEYELKAGVVKTVRSTGEVFTNSNLTTKAAEKILRACPDDIRFFSRYPSNWRERISPKKSNQSKQNKTA